MVPILKGKKLATLTSGLHGVVMAASEEGRFFVSNLGIYGLVGSWLATLPSGLRVVESMGSWLRALTLLVMKASKNW